MVPVVVFMERLDELGPVGPVTIAQRVTTVWLSCRVESRRKSL